MTPNRRHFLKLAAAGTLALSLPAQAGALSVTGGRAFGSYWRLTTPEPAGPAIHGAIAAVIAATDATLSPYVPGSELSRLNRADTADWLPASPEVLAVLHAARATADGTGGAFDPTLGPLTARFGFGPIAGRPGGGFAAVEIGADAIRKHGPGVTLDLCGIAKGRALDRMAAALDALDAGPFLLELGGEVLARGLHPAGRPWQVAIDPGPGVPPLVLALADRAVATSGDLPQGYAVGPKHYSHIIDPRRGAPVTGTIASATVLGPTAMAADAMATGLMAMGAEDAARFAEARQVDAVLLLRDGAGVKPVVTGTAAAALLG